MMRKLFFCVFVLMSSVSAYAADEKPKSDEPITLTITKQQAKNSLATCLTALKSPSIDGDVLISFAAWCVEWKHILDEAVKKPNDVPKPLIKK